MGIPWVIVGHSERRALLEESNDFIGHKAAYALSQDLGVIACIGETLAQREAGDMFDVLTRQLASIGDNIAGRWREKTGQGLHVCLLGSDVSQHTVNIS